MPLVVTLATETREEEVKKEARLTFIMNQQQNAWEGLGGPVDVARPSFDDIDPTLDSCCRREEESIRRGNALKQSLQRHDVVAQKEEQQRRARNLVNVMTFASASPKQGCRCCYDPNSDGGEYRFVKVTNSVLKWGKNP